MPADSDQFILRSTRTSPFGRKARMAAEVLGLASRITLEPGDPLDEDDTLRTQNPLGKMPCLLTGDGSAIYDSGVIIEFLQGVAGSVAPRSYRLAANFERLKADRRNEFLRARINGDGALELFGNQSSGVLTSTVWGDGLIDCPPGLSIARGDMLRFIPFNELLY